MLILSVCLSGRLCIDHRVILLRDLLVVQCQRVQLIVVRYFLLGQRLTNRYKGSLVLAHELEVVAVGFEAHTRRLSEIRWQGVSAP